MADEPTPEEIKLPTFYDSAVPKGLTAEEVAQTTEARRAIVKKELEQEVKWTNKRRGIVQESRAEDQHLAKLLGLYPADKQEIQASENLVELVVRILSEKKNE